MFKRLGRFAVLAVCLFAIVIVMVGCGGDDDPPPITGGGGGGGGQVKTFKQQLTEGSWRIMVGTDGTSLDAEAQAMADEIAGGPGLLKGTMSQNSLRFDDASGKLTWILGFKISDRAAPADTLEMIITLKGPYFISEDLGSSATMTLAITEAAAEMKVLGADVNVPAEVQQELADQFLGEVAEDSRASINGDQLRIGQMLLERN